jgi:hypothetical protein
MAGLKPDPSDLSLPSIWDYTHGHRPGLAQISFKAGFPVAFTGLEHLVAVILPPQSPGTRTRGACHGAGFLQAYFMQLQENTNYVLYFLSGLSGYKVNRF